MTLKESPKQQNCKCCKLGLIEPVNDFMVYGSRGRGR